MFEALGDHAQRQGLHAGDGLVTVGTVAQDARQTGHFGEPTAIIFALDLNRKNHPGTVPSGPLSKGMEAAPQRCVQGRGMWRAAHSRALGGGTPVKLNLFWTFQ